MAADAEELPRRGVEATAEALVPASEPEPEPELEPVAPRQGEDAATEEEEAKLEQLARTGKQLTRGQVREMVRDHMELTGDRRDASDSWIDARFDRFDVDGSGTVDDSEWDSLLASLEPVQVVLSKPPPWGVEMTTNHKSALAVTSVVAGSAAEQAGLEPGMVLTSVNGVRVKDADAGKKLALNSGVPVTLGFDENPKLNLKERRAAWKAKKVAKKDGQTSASGEQESLVPAGDEQGEGEGDEGTEGEPKWKDAKPQLRADTFDRRQASQSILLMQAEDDLAQERQLEEIEAGLRKDLCGLWEASGQQNNTAVKLKFWLEMDDAGVELQGYRFPHTFRDVSILVDFELTEKVGTRWQLGFREVFAGPRATITWTCMVRAATLGHAERSLKQGVWTYRQDMAETAGGGWFHAQDSFEAEWITELDDSGGMIEPEPRIYLEPVTSGPAHGYAHTHTHNRLRCTVLHERTAAQKRKCL
jgi:hypothetical protein